MYHKRWDRKKIFDFVAKEILPQVEYDQWLHVPGEFKDIARLVEQYRRNHNYPQELNAEVRNGLLFLNGDPVERIALMKNFGRRNTYTDAAYHYEGRILARGESDYD